MDETTHIDTLTIPQRLAFRTNAVDWLLVVPNIGVEFDIFPKNYNRWSVGLNLRWRPKTNHTFVVPVNYNIFEIALEGREYWRERECEATGYFQPHKKYWDKLVSCRHRNVSHKNWIFYRGGYVSYGQYFFALSNRYWGSQGDAIQAGFTWGFVKPFLGFNNGTTLDLEVGFSAGLAMTNSEKLKYDSYNSCYRSDGNGKTGWKLLKYPVLRDLHVALVYRIHNYPIQKKYRWRYDVDTEYREKMNLRFDSLLRKKETRFRNDSTYKIVSARYKQLYDSLAAFYQVDKQAGIDNGAPKVVKQDKKKEKTLKDTLQDSINAKKEQTFFHKDAEKQKLTAAQKKEQKKLEKEQKARDAERRKQEKERKAQEKAQAKQQEKEKSTDNKDDATGSKDNSSAADDKTGDSGQATSTDDKKGGTE